MSVNTLNAKGETLFEKASFKSVVKSQRCLLLSTGFFEWKHKDAKTLIPYYIHLKNQPVFAFAGLFDVWSNPAEDRLYRTFSIITAEANPLMAEIHNTKKRMPLILDKAHEMNWIRPDLDQPEIESMIKPFNENQMVAYTVSKLVSSKSQNSNVAEVLKPFEYVKDLFGN